MTPITHCKWPVTHIEVVFGHVIFRQFCPFTVYLVEIYRIVFQSEHSLRACLHGGEVTRLGGVTHLSI